MTKMMTVLALLSCSVASSAFAGPWKYSCRGIFGDRENQTVNLTVNRDELTVEWHAGVAKRDPDYDPARGENKGFYKYESIETGEGYTTEVLIQKDMVRGLRKGVMKWRERGEEFYETTWSCSRRK